MIDLSSLALAPAIALFALAGAVVLVAGTRLTRVADRFADVSALGEAVTGAVFLGAMTSLSGSVVSVAAAWQGHPELAVANALGGIAAQTVFLVIADLIYRRANLEHAAASVPNLLNGIWLVLLLALVLIAGRLPPASVWGVHPVTPLLLVVYGIGVALARQAHRAPQWTPLLTEDTRVDEPDEPAADARSVGRLLIVLLALGVLIAGAGFVIAETGIAIVARTGLRESLVGALMTSVVTSTPELVTTVAAVRRGALTLAVGGILGGNTFDVLFAAFSDLAYRPGSIYHAVGPENAFLALLSIVMTVTLLAGLLHRERRGPANVGKESAALLIVYLAGVILLVRAF